MPAPSSPPPAALLEARFPGELTQVLRRLSDAGHAAYVVGGSLRDLLLGKGAKDYDVATSARAEQVLALFRRVVPTGIKHGTVTVLSGKHAFEVTTFRGEGAYVDGRRPESVVFLDNVVDDLARRDFTINAMAFDPLRGDFVDPFEGRLDLERRRVRCVRDPLERFSEDGLRSLRAVRFASVLDFEIDPATFAAIPATLPTFDKIARERVRDELSKLLAGPSPSRGLTLLRDSGLLGRILPELAPPSPAAEPATFARTGRRLDAVGSRLELRLAALLFELDPESPLELHGPKRRSSTVQSVLERLRLPRKTIDEVVSLVRYRSLAHLGLASEVSLRRALATVGPPLVPPVLELARADASAAGDQKARDHLADLGHALDRVLGQNPPLAPSDLALDGGRIMALLGAGQGPRVGEALRFLLDRVLESPELNSPEALEKLLRTWTPP